MMLNVFCYRNKIIKAYGNPFFQNVEPKDLGISIARSITLNPAGAKDLKCCDLYHLGQFDDETGKFVEFDPVLILNCSDYFTNEEVKDNA